MDVDSPPTLSQEVTSSVAPGITMMSAKGGTATAAAASASSSTSSPRVIKIHPLAIIGISDHHTRVITGGSALPSNSPVVGLLFGYYSTTKSKNTTCDTAGERQGVVTTTTITIVDAEEMIYPTNTTTTTTTTTTSLASGDDEEEAQQQQCRTAILQKIELHQKVFPHHKVVGWYRVASASASASASATTAAAVAVSVAGVEPNYKDENAMDDDEEHHHLPVPGGEGGTEKDKKPVTAAAVVSPTKEDLIMTQSEMKWYCNHSSGGGGSSSSSSSGGGGGGGGGGDNNSPLFVLMDASKVNEDCNSSSGAATKSSGKRNSTALEELESGDELPLTVYETLTTSTDFYSSSGGDGGDSAVVFVNAEFELETYEPERIAVERVFKTQPPPVGTSTSSTSTSTSSSVVAGTLGGGGGGDAVSGINRKTGKKSKKETDLQKPQPNQQQQQQQQSSKKLAFTRGPTEIDSHIVSLQSSIRAMNLRVSVLLEYLQKVERREVPSDDTLLRSIDGIVQQLPLVLAALEKGATATTSSSDGSGRTPLRKLEKEYSNAMLLSYLACTAKTAKAVHVYCEKFRVACESGKSDPRRPLY